jgi:hypothetical protein
MIERVGEMGFWQATLLAVLIVAMYVAIMERSYVKKIWDYWIDEM